MILVFFLGGCSRKAVEIVEPDPGAAAPFDPDDRGNAYYQIYPDGVHRFVVRFDPDFKPETFRAELDGVDITRTFEPLPPSQGGISRAPAPEFFSGGTYVGGGVIITTPQAPAQSRIQTTEGSVPVHKLVVRGEIASSTGMFFWDHDLVNFLAPQPVFRPDFLRRQRGVPSPPVQISLANPPSAAPVVVTIMPMVVSTASNTITNNTVVSLNNQSAGQPITITFPPGEKLKTFYVDGVARGSFWLRATAKGFQVAGVQGFVD